MYNKKISFVVKAPCSNLVSSGIADTLLSEQDFLSQHIINNSTPFQLFRLVWGRVWT